MQYLVGSPLLAFNSKYPINLTLFPLLALVLLLLLLLIFLLLLFRTDFAQWWCWWQSHFLYYQSGYKGYSLPPGSTRIWPLVGETAEFLEPHSATSLGKFMEKHVKRYGNVFKACLFGHPTIVSADAELNKFILLNEDRLFQCSYPSTISGILGQWSMLVLVGEEHKRMRSIALDFMSTHKLKEFFLKDIEHHVCLTLSSWSEDCINLLAQEEAKKFTFNLMARQIVSFNPGEMRTLELMRNYYTFMKGVVAPPFNIPGTAYYKAMKSRAKILDTLKRTLQKRKEVNMVYNDLLGVVTRLGTLSTDQVLDLVLNMLFAGHETSSIALTLTIKFLADAPKVVEELRVEHKSIRKAKDLDGRQGLSWEDYKKMTFTQCVINETLRLGNVVRFVHRKALQDVRFKDVIIPKGWKVLPVFCAVHLDPNVYKNPLEFDPWRWQECGKTLYFSPFGGGNRLCAGGDLAKLEMAFFIHHLVLQFDWELTEPDNAMVYPYVEFEKGLPLKVKKLRNA